MKRVTSPTKSRNKEERSKCIVRRSKEANGTAKQGEGKMVVVGVDAEKTHIFRHNRQMRSQVG